MTEEQLIQDYISQIIKDVDLAKEFTSYCEGSKISIQFKNREAILYEWWLGKKQFYRAVFNGFYEPLSGEMLIEIGSDGMGGLVSSVVNIIIKDWMKEQENPSPEQK